jgi:hypothetical protein
VACAAAVTPAELTTSVPHSARIHDYLLEGKDDLARVMDGGAPRKPGPRHLSGNRLDDHATPTRGLPSVSFG